MSAMIVVSPAPMIAHMFIENSGRVVSFNGLTD
jgi:hypothetical protein